MKSIPFFDSAGNSSITDVAEYVLVVFLEIVSHIVIVQCSSTVVCSGSN